MSSEINNYPKISVILQSFNRKDYIGKTIRSVIDQDYPNIECIVIDDGSVDGSWEVIQSFKDRLAYIEQRHSKDTTPVPALNIGFSKATGEIMTSLNDKNLLLPGSLRAIAKVFTTYPQIEWITGINTVTNPEDIIVSVMPIRKSIYEHLLGYRWNIQHESTFWKKSLWDRVGGKFSMNHPWAFDSDLWCRFFVSGAKLYYLNTLVGSYRKLPTAHSVKHQGMYYSQASTAYAYLRKNVPKSELYWAELYGILRYFKPILRNIPDNVYTKIPILRHFAQDSIAFKNMHELKSYKRNPFRTIYPW
jgi:glycosyltransferase involved in cell wall biosynthesis